MARPGVTYQDVANAASQLKGQDKNVTIEHVRAILGTGSVSTISNHLRKWKMTQDETLKIASKEHLPQELVAMLKGLWEQLLLQSAMKITTIEQNHQSAMAELEEELQKYKNNNQRWQQLYSQWMQEKSQMAGELAVLKEGLESLQKENTSLSTQQNTLLQQLHEKHERITELHRLHQQVQTNLEHYRESAREQRLIDQQQFEQVKIELQSQLKNHKEQAVAFSEKYTKTHQEHLLLQQDFASLKKKHEDIFQLYEQAQLNIHENAKIMSTLHQKNEHLQLQYQKTEEKNIAGTQEHARLQTDIKIFAYELKKTVEKLEEALAQNKLLAHDKWIISQEKSQLEGQLKQAEKMIEREKSIL